jgi:hypothetical protein
MGFPEKLNLTQPFYNKEEWKEMEENETANATKN